MFKKIAYILMFVSLPLVARELTTFDNIQLRTGRGQFPTFVLNTEQCDIQDHNAFKIPHSIMVVKPSVALVLENQMVAFDGQKFAASKSPYYNYNVMQRASLILYADGKLEEKIEFFDADHNVKSPDFDEVQVTCQLGKGLRVYDYS